MQELRLLHQVGYRQVHFYYHHVTYHCPEVLILHNEGYPLPTKLPDDSIVPDGCPFNSRKELEISAKSDSVSQQN